MTELIVRGAIYDRMRDRCVAAAELLDVMPNQLAAILRHRTEEE